VDRRHPRLPSHRHSAVGQPRRRLPAVRPTRTEPGPPPAAASVVDRCVLGPPPHMPSLRGRATAPVRAAPRLLQQAALISAPKRIGTSVPVLRGERWRIALRRDRHTRAKPSVVVRRLKRPVLRHGHRMVPWIGIHTCYQLVHLPSFLNA
jgi:hypothetical protein